MTNSNEHSSMKPSARSDEKHTIMIADEGTVLETETENETLWYLEHLGNLEHDGREAIRAITKCLNLGDKQGMREWAARADRLSEISCWADYHLLDLHERPEEGEEQAG